MKSIKMFSSSEQLKNLNSIKGGVKDPVYSLSPTVTKSGAHDEDLITANGTGDCTGFFVGNADCIDARYIC